MVNDIDGENAFEFIEYDHEWIPTLFTYKALETIMSKKSKR